MNARKQFPILGVYAVRGGIPGHYYLNHSDRRRYRFVLPASYVQPTAVIGDCWIVDRHGEVNPGTNVSPVPFARSVIGRRISASSARQHGPSPVPPANACPENTGYPVRIVLGKSNWSAAALALDAKADDDAERSDGPPSWRREFFLAGDEQTSLVVTVDEAEEFEAATDESLVSDVLAPKVFKTFSVWLEGPAEDVPDRLGLIRRVLAKAHDECESWRDNFLGVQLAYLALAIAEDPSDGGERGFVDWSPEIGDPDLTATLQLFRQWFPPDDLVWGFIRAG